MINFVDVSGELSTVEARWELRELDCLEVLILVQDGKEIHLSKPMATALNDYTPFHSSQHPGGSMDCYDKCPVRMAKS